MIVGGDRDNQRAAGAASRAPITTPSRRLMTVAAAHASRLRRAHPDTGGSLFQIHVRHLRCVAALAQCGGARAPWPLFAAASRPGVGRHGGGRRRTVTARALRGMGLVSEALKPEGLAQLPGRLAIGHTRYSTTGSIDASTTRSRCSRASGAATSRSLTTETSSTPPSCAARSRSEGSIFSSTMDSEVIVHRMARAKSDRPEERLAEALRGVEGAYCLLVAIADTLIAARDPRGWRPLVHRPPG